MSNSYSNNETSFEALFAALKLGSFCYCSVEDLTEPHALRLENSPNVDVIENKNDWDTKTEKKDGILFVKSAKNLLNEDRASLNIIKSAPEKFKGIGILIVNDVEDKILLSELEGLLHDSTFKGYKVVDRRVNFENAQKGTISPKSMARFPKNDVIILVGCISICVVILACLGWFSHSQIQLFPYILFIFINVFHLFCPLIKNRKKRLLSLYITMTSLLIIGPVGMVIENNFLQRFYFYISFFIPFFLLGSLIFLSNIEIWKKLNQKGFNDKIAASRWFFGLLGLVLLFLFQMFDNEMKKIKTFIMFGFDSDNKISVMIFINFLFQCSLFYFIQKLDDFWHELET